MKLHTVLDKNNIRGLLCLFRSSPTLHTLILKIITHFKAEKTKVNSHNTLIFPLILWPILMYVHSRSLSYIEWTFRVIDFEHLPLQAWNKALWDHMSSSEQEQYWESRSQTFKSFLQHLKVVRMEGLVESENEIGLIKFLLKHGMALQEMVLCSGHSNSRDPVRRHEIRSQMMGFSWASSNAKLAFHWVFLLHIPGVLSYFLVL